MIPAIDLILNLSTADVLSWRPARMGVFYQHMGIGGKTLKGGYTVEEELQLMDEGSIEKGLMPARALGDHDMDYEVVRDVCQKHPDRFYGLAGINPFTGMKGVKKLERAV